MCVRSFGLSALRRVPFVVAVLLVTGLVPAADAQSTEMDLAIASFSVDDPLRLDAQNGITATVSNDGAAPSRALVRIIASDDAIQESVLHEETSPLLFEGETHAISIQWNGRDLGLPSGAPLQDDVEVRVEVSPADVSDAEGDPSDNTASVQRFMVVHALDVTVEAPGPSEEVAPGDRWWTTVEIHNLGNLPDDIDITVSDQTPGWTFTPSRTMLQIAKGDVEVLFMFVDAPSGGAAGSVGQATLTATPRQASHASMDAAVETPPLGKAGSLTVTLQPAAIQGAAGTTASAEVVVRNDQNFQDTFEILLEPLDETETLVPSTTPAQLTVPAGAQAAFDVDIPIPASANAGSHSWSGQVFSTLPDGEVVHLPQLLTLDITQEYAVRLDAAPAPAQLDPGHNTILTFTVHNDGNGEDQLRLEAIDLPPGWSLGRPAGEVLTLQAGQSQEAEWELFVPSDAPAEPHVLDFILRSVYDATASDDARIVTEVQERVFPVIDVATTRLPVTGGGTTLFQLDLRNEGNTDGAFTLVHQINASATSPQVDTWGVELLHGDLVLDAGDASSGSLEIEAPADLGAGDGIIVNLTLTAIDDPTRTTTVVLQAFPPFADLKTDLDSVAPAALYRGHPGTANVTVRNDGAAPAGPFTVVSTFFLPGDGEPLKQAVHELSGLGWESGQNQTTISVEIPTDVEASEITMVIEVDEGEVVAERDETNNVWQGSFGLRTFNITITPPLGLEVAPGQAIAFDGDDAFVVTNDGSHAEALRVDAWILPAWTEATTTDVTLLPGESTVVSLDFLVPPRPGAPEGVVVVKASHTELALNATTATRLVVTDDEAPQIHWFTSDPPSPVMDDLVLLEANVTDALGVVEVVATIAAPDGTTSEVPLAPTDQGTWAATTSFPTPGLYDAFLRARDGSLAGNIATSGSTLAIDVAPPSHPVIRLHTPTDGASIRPGTPIVFNVFTQFPLVEAEYERLGTVSTMPAAQPLQVPTADWSEGEQSIQVSVVDANGATGMANHSFVVDATPPKVTSIRIDAASLRAGQTATVTAWVEDASPIAKATLRLAGADGARDIAMNATGNTTHATFQVPAGLDSLTVIVEDAAGNRGFGERSTESLLAVDDKDSPAWGAVPAAILLAVAVVLRRRRP